MKFTSACSRFILLSVVVLGSTAARAAERWIVENGEPRAEIVIAEQPARSVRVAADDLRTYVQKMSGARLPIVTQPSADRVKLFVGRSAHTDKLGVTADGLKNGAFRLVSGDDWLVMIGDDTDFAPKEPYSRSRADIASGKLQSAWEEISGTKTGVPQASTYKNQLKMPADLGLPDGQAVAANATPWVLWAFDERGSFNGVCDFLQRLGVRWYMPGELGEVVPEMKSIALPKIDETVRPDFDVRRFCVRFGTARGDTARWSMRLGLRDPFGLQVAHGIATMTGRDEIFAAHPDWFAMYGGKRKYVPGYSKNQVCYSNEELFQATLAYVRAQFDHYDFDTVSVMPPDGYTAICQCPLCEGKANLERGSRGALSNHVWEFVNRVAKEIGKTHPGKLIVNAAYGSYTDVPTNIEKLEPNVQVVIVGGRRPRASSAEEQAQIRELRNAWIAKTDRPIMIFENYPITGRGWYLPAYVARTTGESINETKGVSAGEDIWLSFGPDFEENDLGFNHFQVYFTARMYWGGKKQDVNAMLDEYCRLFYGPAGREMRSFFDYCEDNWQQMETDKTKGDAALELFAAAKSKVEVSTVYERRLALIDEFLNGLRRKNEQLAQKRGVVPKLRMVGDAKDIVIDGKLDEAYWQNCPTAATGRLRELQTGRVPTFGTLVKSGWAGDSVYFAIRCDEHPGEKLNVTSTKKEDSAIWYGDAIELLIASDAHSYYQIAVNPAGALVDFDRGSSKDQWSGWESQAEVATQMHDDHWTVEIRIPVTDDENDPLNQIVGHKPTQSLPWYLNICRQRLRDDGAEFSALSPTGTNGFHDPLKFAHFYDGRSHAFESDPTIMTFVSSLRAAAQLATEKKHAEAMAAFLALTEGKVTDLQKSTALEQAAVVACAMKDYARADELTAGIPIEAVKKVSQMNNLLAQRKAPEVVAQFGSEDLAAWPFWKRGDAHWARARAYKLAGDADKTAAELKLALEFTADPRLRATILELSGEKKPVGK